MGKDRDPGDQKQQQEHPQSAASPSSVPRDPKMQAARVRLPDGVYKEFEVNRGSEGEALFRQVTSDLSIEEREYFSLCFYDKEEGVRHWLYNDKKIIKQLKNLPWEFSFEVKFYPTTPTTLVDDHARYYLFLQLRRDILTGRLPATADTHAMLGSFVAQIEFGDAPSQMNDDYEKFIVNSKLVPADQSNPEQFKKIAELHRELRGQTTSEAENLFLEHCKQLALYGIHLFKAIDKDKKPVDIGVGAAGVNIYQDAQKIHSLLWQNIIKIGYKRSYFSVKLKAGTVGREEKTLYYKLPTHLAAKRAWKCAVEHHTFFRLIQPEERPHKSFFNFGSQRFRYQGRTQFQTKMASQMFDRPSNVDRAPSSMSQPITSTEEQRLNTLNLTDSELEQRNFERYRRALTPKSYTRGTDDDDAISSATFAKYSRPSTLLVSTTSTSVTPHPQHDLSYSPRGLDDSNLSSAAYYMSERSSLRTPSSAYYPPSEYAMSSAMQSPIGDSPHYFEAQNRGEYHVQMRQQTASSSSGGARRNLFGRQSGTSAGSVRLVSFHEPIDPDQPIPNTYPVNELPQIPIERIVHVYHEGHYDRLSPRREQQPRAELPYGFGVYTPRNGVTHVDRLEPHGEMDQQPIRFFVDVRHSGTSRRDPAKRLSHPGKEDVKEQIDPKDYQFATATTSDPLHRTELTRDVQPANIQQYTRRYHHGDSTKLNEPSTSAAPQYRLITHVQPLVVSHHQRDSRNGQHASSNVNATISQREQVVSTKVRRESPDADRRVRLSASVDRSGNVTDTTEEMGRSSTSTTEASTSTTVVETKKHKKQRIPPTSSPQKIVKERPVEQVEQSMSSTKHESRSRFAGFFSKGPKKTKTTTGYPQTSEQYTGVLDSTIRDHDLEASPFHHGEIPAYSPKKLVADTPEASIVETESTRYRLISRFRHEGHEDVVEKPSPYKIASVVYEGELEPISRGNEIEESPIADHSTVYHHGESWRSAGAARLFAATPEKKQKKEKVKSPKKPKVAAPIESEAREVRLIARVQTEPKEQQATEPLVKEKKPKKEGGIAFYRRQPKPARENKKPEEVEGLPERFRCNTDSEWDVPVVPPTTPPASPATSRSVEDLPKVVHEKKVFHWFSRFRHDGDEDEIEKPDAYAFASVSYDGPLETTSHQEIDYVPLRACSTAYHHGESWRVEKKQAFPVAEKKEKKQASPKEEKSVEPVKSPKKEKFAEPEEPETREVRLIARVKTQSEEEQVAEPLVKEKKPKKEGSKFGFFSRTTKTTKTAGYPETSEQFTGELDTTDRRRDLETSPFDHPDIPAYSPKKSEAYEPSASSAASPEQTEPIRYFQIFRFRHDGEEDEVEKTKLRPEAYGFASTSYDGPLEETNLERDLEHLDLGNYSTPYHHGESWRTAKKTALPISSVEANEKKVKPSKKANIPESEDREITKVRLLTRVPPSEENEQETTAAKSPRDSSAKSKFGFFKKTTKTKYPEPTEGYSGSLESTSKTQDLENIPFEHREITVNTARVISNADPAVQHEKKRYRLVARFRHQGDEDEVEKPDAYGFATDAYEGVLEDISRTAEIDHAPLADHSTVYHHGESWRVEKPVTPVVTLEKKQKKFKSPKREQLTEPEEPETREVRLIARVKTQPEEEQVAEPLVMEKKPKKEGSKFGFFSRTTKTTKTAGYPETSDQFTGELDTTDRSHDLEASPFEHGDYPVYSPKKLAAETPEFSVVEPEKKRYRLIARFRHDGDEDVVERPDAYAFASTSYEGPLEDIRRQEELDQAPLADHATVYHHGESWRVEKPVTPVATLEKKQKKVKSPKKEKIAEPEEPGTREVRLIARVKTEPEDEDQVAVPVVKEKKSKKEGSKFGFFSRTTKTSKTSGYPEVSEQYTGELDTTDRSRDIESSPFEHGEYPVYSPKKLVSETPEVPVAEPEKKRYRLIARFRHDGDEDFVEKPDAYAFGTDVYDGPLDETSRQAELDQSPLADHSAAYHHGESWRIEKPVSPAAASEKTQKKVKSPKKEKITEPEETETREVRLIARVKTQPEEEPVAEPVVMEEKPKKEGSKFGFFSRSHKTTGYPKPTGEFIGELDTTHRTDDLESSPFEHRDVPAYTLKKRVVEESPEGIQSEQPEKQRYRLIARFRHDGDEDVVEKPEFYGFAPEAYNGPLEDTSLNSDLAHAPIGDHSAVYHHGMSWIVEKPTSPTTTLEKTQKKVKSPKKEKITEPEEPETREVRLIARVKPQPEEEPVAEPVVKEKKPKKEGSKIGFFSRSAKTTKTSGYPETSEQYTGELDTTDRSRDLEASPFEHGDFPAYSPRKIVVENVRETVASPEKKRYRLIARFRHEGDEEVVEKPDAYGFPSTLHEGPLEETSRQKDLEQTPLSDHSTVYHHGESWRTEKPTSPVATLEKKQKKVKSPKKEKTAEPVDPETTEVRLIARVQTEPEEEAVFEKASRDKKPKKDLSKSKLPAFGFFHRTQTPSTSQDVTEKFTGPLETTQRSLELETSLFEHNEIPAYSPKKVATQNTEAHEEKKRYRLIARFRHDGEQDVVERPDAYAFGTDTYDGPLEDIRRQEDLEQSPLADHSAVYHHGESWRIEKPAVPVVEKKPKVKSPKKEKVAEPEEPETREIRLIARVKTEPQDEEPAAVPVVKEKKSKKAESKFGFFSRSTKATKTSGYPETSDQFTGELDTTDRSHDLEASPFEHGDYPVYSPKKLAAETPEFSVVEPEKKRYRLIARFRHDGDEDVVERPDAYAFASTSYEGPLEDIRRQEELEQAPLADHATVYHHGESWRVEKPVTPVATLEKKQKKVKSPKKEKIAEPEEPESREVRLIARVKTEPEDEDQVAVPVVKEKKSKKEGSKFGFFSRTTKATKTSGYPEVSELYTGELDTTDRSRELEGSPFEHGDFPAYSPSKIVVENVRETVASPEKKRYRLIARFRHEGDEEVVEKPDAYGFPSTLHEGPLEETSRQKDLEQTPLSDHSTVYHHGESWRTEKPTSPVATLEKKQKKVKSPKKEKTAEPVEPETREVRLIARVKTQSEEEQVAEPVVKEKKPKKEKSKFGFFSRTTETTKTTGYPETSEQYTGELDTTDRSHDLESSPFEHGDYPVYSPKKLVSETPEVSVTEPEKKRYRLIARFRHDGDEDFVEKPDAYAFGTDVYDGPLDETSRQAELDQSPLADHSTAYHHGESWRIEKPAVPVVEKKPKVKSPKKEKVAEPEEPETREVRLIARVKTEPQDEEPAAVPVVKEKKSKKAESKFGFFSRSTKATKTSGYPETSDQFTGELDTTDRSHDLEASPFEHGDYPVYSPKKLAAETPEFSVVEPEKKRYRLIARFRHDGDEDVVERPDAYAFASTSYEGPLEDIRRQEELEQAPLADHATVYHHGESWRVEKPVTPVATLEKKQKKVKSPKKEKIAEPEEPESREVRLIARVKTEPEDEDQVAVPVVKEKKSKKEGSKFGFFSRTTMTSKTSGHPEVSEQYTGELDTTDRSREIESSPFEHGEYPVYSPKKLVSETPEVPVAEPEKKRYRLIARFRHDGDEDFVEKPDAYAFGTDVYDGPLDETSRQAELDQSPLADHSAAYHHGESWRIEKPVSPAAASEKTQKKVKSPKKEKITEPEETETREVRLIARVKTQPEEEPVAEPVVMEEKPKKEGSKFGFFSRSHKTTGYPKPTGEFIGELDTTHRTDDLESSPFEHRDVPAYSPETVERQEEPTPVEKKRYYLFSRFRHDGDEDIVEKPDAYGLASKIYEGPLEDIHRQEELDQAPLADHSTVYHHGESWRVEKPVTPVATLEKKQKKVKSMKKEEVAEPTQAVVPLVRLIARVKSEQDDEDVAVPVAKEKKSKKERSKFGFFSRSTKATKASGYPETSDQFTGELDTTDRSHDLEASPFEHGDYPVYSPKKLAAETPEVSVVEPEKKRYRLIARFRHDGDEDVVERPDAYAFASTSYEGPLEDIRRQEELEQAPLADHATVYHHGESWRVEKPVTPVATLEKKQKKVKSPKKEKIAEPEEPESREVRLIARVKTEPEDEDQVAVPVVKEKKSKKEGPKFGFFFRTTKSTKTSGYPETSEQYTGELDTTDRSRDLEASPFEHGDFPAYSPRKIVVENVRETVASPEKKRYRLIARFRHEGDEEVVEKPDAYGFPSTLHEGPLEETSRQKDLEQTPLSDHSTVYHHGESWRTEKPISPVATLEKKQKKVKSPKKEKVVEESETKEIRLIALVKTEPEEEQVVAEPAIKEKKSKKEGSKFGLFSRFSNSPKLESVTEPSYEGPLDSTLRSDDLEGIPFEHTPTPSPLPTVESIEVPTEPNSTKEHKEKWRFRWFDRFRHDGDEDEVEKPDAYAIGTDVYDGPLEEISRNQEIDQTLISDHSNVYHHGESWRKEKPTSPVVEKKSKKVKAESTPEPEETHDVRLLARIQPLRQEEDIAPIEKSSPTKERSRASSFNFFHRQSKSSGYPEASPIYEGELDVTGRTQDVETVPLETRDYPEYSPKKQELVEQPQSPQHHHESRIYRLIARFRHEGEEDVVEKPNAYEFGTDVYHGPLDEISKQTEVDQAPIGDFSTVYHHGESWRKEATPVVATLEKKLKKQKKEKSPKKELGPVEQEGHDVKLLARVNVEEQEDVSAEESQKKEDTASKPFRLRFLSLTSNKKLGGSSAYPESSPTYEGPLDVTGRSEDLEKMPYLHGQVPPYSPKVTPVVPNFETDKKRRFIARYRHEGYEDVIERPPIYPFRTYPYTGPLSSLYNNELEEAPIGNHSTVYHHGDSWKDKRSIKRVPKEKDGKDVRLVAKVLPHEKEPSTSETSAEKSPRAEKEGSKPFRFRFFSLSNKSTKGAEIAEPPSEPEEKKRYRLIARFRHEGEEDVVEKPAAYGFESTFYDGPLEEISRETDIDQTPIADHSSVYHHGESWRVEKEQPKKVRVSTDMEQQPEVNGVDENTENVPPASTEKTSRFSFLRGVKPNRSARATSYPSTSANYTGPLAVTGKRDELEPIPLEHTGTIPKYLPKVSTEAAGRKYRLIARIRHDGAEDELPADKLSPWFYSFPVTEHSANFPNTPHRQEIDECPIMDYSTVYHSGVSGQWLRQAIIQKLGKDKRSSTSTYKEPKPDVKLIARVKPMTKTSVPPSDVVSDDEKIAEPLTRSAELESLAMTDIVGPSTSSARNSNLVIEETINYFPSSLQYEPRAARIEGYTGDGSGYVEVRLERRAEVQLEPVYVLRETTARSHAYLSTATGYFSGASASSASASSAAAPSTSHLLVPFVGSVSEDETGLHFSTTPLNMSPPERPSLLARLGFKRDKNKDKKKDKKSKGKKENESSETSDSEHDEKREFAVVEFEPQQHDSTTTGGAGKKSAEGPKKPEHRTHKSPGRRSDEPMNEVTVVVTGGSDAQRPAEIGNTKEVRHETREQQFRLTGDGYTSGFNPNDPSLMATIQRAERLNASSPRLEHAERTFTVRANAPLPVSFEESGQPYTTVSTWQETSDLPEQVEVYTDENGRQITRTIKSSQVKHTVQTQSFQNYIVDGDQVPVGVVDVERSREQLTPIGQSVSSTSGAAPGADGIVETQTRTMTYEAQGGENAAPPGWAEQGLGEYVSSKSVTQGNRTIETITYKTEKDGVVETHVEHRVTIHSDGDIDHDAELSQAILEATQMNPDMVVEKIEVRQETTQ